MQHAHARVLVVDDDEGTRITTAASLEHCDVTLAVSAAEALKHVAVLDFDVVVCDLVMPEMTGVEFYEALPADSALRARFVFMTGGALPAWIQSFLALTAVPVLQKPFRVAELRKAVDAAFGA